MMFGEEGGKERGNKGGPERILFFLYGAERGERGGGLL